MASDDPSVKATNEATSVPEVRFQIRTMLVQLALTSRRPSAANATEAMRSPWLESVRMSPPGRHIEKPDGAVMGAGRQRAAVAREGDAADAAEEAAECTLVAAVGGLPKLDRPVP